MTPPKPKSRWYHLTPDRLFIGLLVIQVFLLLSGRFRWFPFNEHKGWTVMIAVGVVVGAVLVMLVWGLVCLFLRRRFQFSFRSLLVFLVVLSVPLGWFAWEMQWARQQREAVERIVKVGGTVRYDYEMNELGLKYWVAPATPTWLRDLLRDDFFCDVAAVSCEKTEFGDKEASILSNLPNLEELILPNTQVTDDGLRHLTGLTNLEFLSLDYNQITGAGLEHLKDLTNLRFLVLDSTPLTDAGLAHLRELSNLKWLCLDNTEITDNGLTHLKSMTRLETLDLRRTQVTPEGIIQFRHALPNCEIRHSHRWRAISKAVKSYREEPKE